MKEKEKGGERKDSNRMRRDSIKEYEIIQRKDQTARIWILPSSKKEKVSEEGKQEDRFGG